MEAAEQKAEIAAILPATDGWYAQMESGDRLAVIAWLVTDRHEAGGLVVAGDMILPAWDLEDFRADCVTEYVHKPAG